MYENHSNIVETEIHSADFGTFVACVCAGKLESSVPEEEEEGSAQDD